MAHTFYWWKIFAGIGIGILALLVIDGIKTKTFLIGLMNAFEEIYELRFVIIYTAFIIACVSFGFASGCTQMAKDNAIIEMSKQKQE
jgi:hypothetical protein